MIKKTSIKTKTARGVSLVRNFSRRRKVLRWLFFSNTGVNMLRNVSRRDPNKN
jgi:hypothetical protein